MVTGAPPFAFFGEVIAIGRSSGYLKGEAHDGLVDAADLFDIEVAVAEPFAVEDEQVLEDAMEHAVRDAGNRR